MELKESPDPRRPQLIPVVAYAVERRIASGEPDYWDYATRLELSVLAKDKHRAAIALEDAIRRVLETWEPETKARVLHLINEVSSKRNELEPWAQEVEQALRGLVAISKLVGKTNTKI